jgi:iron complex outermembrane receptor protein
VCGLISSLVATAQHDEADTTIRLDEVVITQSRLQNYAAGHYILPVDTLTSRLASMTSAAELMRKFGYGHIRSYGVGGIATPSFRGTGASHTSVLWNGINLVSPLNGQSDLSLLPISFVDDVQIQSGGSASLYGSGAIGGTLSFNSKAVFNQGLGLSLTENIGSFGTYFHGLSTTWSKKKSISSTKVFQTSAENNFKFANRNSSPPIEQHRQHSAFRQFGILQQNYFQISQRQLLSLRFWYQDNNTEIPNPVTVVAPELATQRDRFFRSMIGWNFDYKEGHLFVQSAQVHHMLDYRDPLINLASISTFDTFINTAENTLDLGHELEWTTGMNYTHELAKGDELRRDKPGRNRLALYSALKHNAKKIKSVLSLRQELLDSELTPFSASVGTDVSVHRSVSLFGNVSRSYRIPTFNDLYWNGAGAKGNPDLQPETSWSKEAGVKIDAERYARTRSQTKPHLKIQAAIFSNQVDDWILWAPSTLVWSAENIKKVWSRGVESNSQLTTKLGEVTTDITVRYSYTRSTSEAVYDPSRENEIGKQLFFTPKHESGVTARAGWRSWNLAFTNNYTGKQYTDDTNSEFYAMKGYNVTNVWLSKDLKFKKLTILFMTELNNIFNNEINSRPGYPLPGRNFKAGITIKFNQPIRI